MSDKDTLKLVIDTFNISKEYRDAKKEIMDESFRLYKAKLKPEEKVGRNHIFLPAVFAAVQTILARLEPATLTDPFGVVIPMGPDDERASEIHNGILKHQLEISKIYKAIKGALFNFVVFGNGFLKIVPKNLFKNDYDVEMSVADNYDLYPDVWAGDIEDSEYIIHKTHLSKEMLKKLKKNDKYKNIQKAIKTLQGDSEDGVNLRRAVSGQQTFEKRAYNDNRGRPYEKLEYWTEDRRIEIINRRIVIFDEENILGRIPFVKFDNMNEMGEFYSTGDVKEAGPINILINRLKQQRYDNVELVLHRMWNVVRGQGVDLDQLVSQAGGIVMSDVKGAVEPILTPDVTSSSYQEEQLLKIDLQRINGLSDPSQAVAGQVEQTATEINTLREATNQRFKQKLINIAMAQKQVVNHYVDYNSRFMPDDIIVEMTDSLGQRYIQEVPNFREQLQGRFNFSGQANLFIENKQIRMQKFIGLLQIFAQDPEINSRALKREILKMSGVHNVDEILLRPDEVQLRQEQAQEEQRAQQEQAINFEREKQDRELDKESLKGEIEIEKARTIEEIRKQSKGEATSKKETRGRKAKK